LSELSKYEVLLNDLSSIQVQAAIITHKCKDLTQRNKELEEFLSEARKEKINLTQKVNELENDLKALQNNNSVNIINTYNEKEKESLKIKLQNLISRIDYHLSADPSRRKLDEADKQV
jgi:predicted nuclease with TOPRIM domain